MKNKIIVTVLFLMFASICFAGENIKQCKMESYQGYNYNLIIADSQSELLSPDGWVLPIVIMSDLDHIPKVSIIDKDNNEDDCVMDKIGQHPNKFYGWIRCPIEATKIDVIIIDDESFLYKK